jgi:cobalt-precorrin-5B (C1)-methyltransferase
VVEIAIPNGEALAARTLNSRLGIVGGLSVLGTTGVVVPYSCSAWIASIHRGIDVARAMGIAHIAGATGATSEAAVRKLYGLPDAALIDMGDFVGGLLKYLRTHPVARITVAGGVAKMSKLAQGLLDLHSQRGTIDRAALAALAVDAGGSSALARRIAAANTTAEAFGAAAAERIALGDRVARAAWDTAARVIADTPIALEIAVFDRDGQQVGHAPFASAHKVSPVRNRRR